MQIFFDAEFTQLRQDSTLMSIGLISEDGRKIYCEFTDYNKDLVDDWLEENVIPHMICTKIKESKKKNEYCYVPPYFVYGDTLHIRTELIKWLKSFGEDIQLISDVCHYDMVFFINIFGKTAFDLPEFINPSCHDINQDIAKHFNISEKEAFNLNRESILGTKEEAKHNALVDAIVIRNIYNKICK